MAESTPSALPRSAAPGSRSEDLLTDSETVLTPEGGSSSSGAGPDAARLGGTAATATKTTATSTAGMAVTEQAISDTPTLGAAASSAEQPESPDMDAAGGTASSSRAASFSGSSSYQEDWDIPPLDRLTVLDLLDNFALPYQLEKLEKLSKGLTAQTRKRLARSRDVLKSRSQVARTRMVEEWRRHRVVATTTMRTAASAEEQLDRYRKRMLRSVEKLGRQWSDTKAITMREKVSFIFGVLNIFISGYLIGGAPEWMHVWYTMQILYFMPIRYFTYQRRGYHYFLADLCYFVNLLLVLSLWVLPHSRRLLLATYCLAFGNNAIAIVMWRNSLVFHSFDKVTSLFIHIMPCATLHCVVHLLDPALQKSRFPAVYALRHAAPGSPVATYSHAGPMLLWSSIPYAIWQLSYYFFITVRRRDKIAAGRPTSFTWLRRSYSKTWIGHLVLGLPEALQESAFMLIQYSYAVLTMLPCPLWFRYRWASSTFLMAVFTWSIYNGATFYIDVFGNRFQKEVEALKAEVAKWQSTESLAGLSGGSGGGSGGGGGASGTSGDPNIGISTGTDIGISAACATEADCRDADRTHNNVASPPLDCHDGEDGASEDDGYEEDDGASAARHRSRSSLDAIPLLDDTGDETGDDTKTKSMA